MLRKPVQSPAPIVPPTPPVPTGEKLEDLVDECCRWIEVSLGNRGKKKLGPDFRPDQHDRSSPALAEGRTRWDSSAGHGGVRSWVVEGTLRDISQLRQVVNEYLDIMELRVRRRKADPDWKFDNSSMKWCSQKFGAPFTPDPTLEEIRARLEADERERQRQMAGRLREQQDAVAHEKEFMKQLRVKRLLRELSQSFFTMDDCDLTVEPLSGEYSAAKAKREVFRKFSEDLIRSMVEADMSDLEIKETAESLNRVSKGSFASTPQEPWKDGEVRQYFNDWRDILPFSTIFRRTRSR